MLHRFFISSNQITPPTVQIDGDTARQIRTVLRLQPGNEIIVLDNSGQEWRIILTDISKNKIRARIVNQQACLGEPILTLRLYQGTLKGQKFEWVLQKGTELGVSSFVPTICKRSIVRGLSGLTKKRTRWQQIMREAAEQSCRGKLPQLEQACTFEEALAQAKTSQLQLIPWEEVTDISLKQVLTKTSITNIALFIGPEGGFAPEEIELAKTYGVKPVSLGKRILRSETAAIAAVANIMYELNE